MALQIADDATPMLSSEVDFGPFSILLTEFPALVAPTFHSNIAKHGGFPVHSRFRQTAKKSWLKWSHSASSVTPAALGHRLYTWRQKLCWFAAVW